MDAALLLTALLMGLAGSLHCTAMCGAACTALASRCDAARPAQALFGFHAGRLIGYAAGGGVAAASVGALATLAQAAPALRPLWTLVHAAALLLGLWLLWQGRQPAWMGELAAAPAPRLANAGTGNTWQPLRGPTRAAAVGSLWIALPCGLLQSALLVAALANTPLAGAAVMATFALASSLGLTLGPALWWRAARSAPSQRLGGWVVRLSGAMLAGASAWALGHDLWLRVIDYCLA